MVEVGFDDGGVHHEADEPCERDKVAVPRKQARVRHFPPYSSSFSGDDLFSSGAGKMDEKSSGCERYLNIYIGLVPISNFLWAGGGTGATIQPRQVI